jgi:hypothetical protein
MDPITITLNANIELLRRFGVDPSTSEGKAKIIEIILLGLEEFKPHCVLNWEIAVTQALTQEM